MKFSLIIALTVGVAVVGCGEPSVSEKKPEPKSENNTEVAPMLYFKASGNEPGWILNMMSSEQGTFPVELVLDYGADTLRGNLTKIPIMEQSGEGKGSPTVGTNEVKYTGNLVGNDRNEALKLAIVSGICSDDADKQHGTSVTITLSDQVLRGCGDYFE
jgi:uncharacterized membrane protein